VRRALKRIKEAVAAADEPAGGDYSTKGRNDQPAERRLSS